MFLIVKTSGRGIKDGPITPLREGFCVIELKYLAYLPLSRITVARQLRNRIGFLLNILKKRQKKYRDNDIYIELFIKKVKINSLIEKAIGINRKYAID